MQLVRGANTNDLLAQAASFIPTTYLDAKGIFTAIIVSIGCVEIMRVMLKKNIRFKMPEGVPPAIASSFDSILPLFVCMGVFYGLSLIIQNISGELLPSYNYCSNFLVLWFTWCKYYAANQTAVYANVFNGKYHCFFSW